METLQALERLIAPLGTLHDDGVPTASIAMLDSDGHLAAHVITSGKEDTQTLYQACSISKAITALAVAKLVDMSVISYDDKIVTHIPHERLKKLGKTEVYMQDVTIGALVSHRSGLSQHGFPGYAGDVPTLEDIFNGRPPANTPRIRFNSVPFAQLSYSGGGFLLLQICLEHATGMSFVQLMHDLVFEPLGMSRSTYADLAASEHNYARAFLTADQGSASPHGYHRMPESAAAGLWTTPTDLLKTISAIQYALKYDDGFLSKHTARQMLAQVTPNVPIYSMAMGWGSDDQFFAHRGDNEPGYQTYFFGSHEGVVNGTTGSSPSSPYGQAAVAIMINSVQGFSTIQKILAALFWLNKWSRIESLPGNFGSCVDFVPYAAPRDTPLGHSWREWIGDWNHGFTISDDHGGPVLSFASQTHRVRLRPAASPSFVHGSKTYQVLVAEGLNMALRVSGVGDDLCLHLVQSDGTVELGTRSFTA